MESIKAVVEEVKCISGYSHIVPNSENSFCGGCCEGTVFTFTSAASNGRLRQRLRCRASTLKPHGRREEVTDTVISELRIMPPSRETSSADGEVPYLTYEFMSTQLDGARKSNGENSVCETNQSLAQNPVDYKQLARRIGREHGGEIRSSLTEKSVASLKQPESLKDGLHGMTFPRGESYYPLPRSGEASSEQGWRREEKDSVGASIDQLDSKNRVKMKLPEPFINDMKDERNHKRYSCPEQVNNFERRKLRCNSQREEERFTGQIESVHNEFGCKVRQHQAKRTELRMVEFAECEGRLGIDAELRNLQARQHVTGLKLNMRRKGQARLSEQAYDVVKDLDSGVPNQTTMEVDDKKECHAKENGRFATAFESFAAEGLGLVSPSQDPLACSFISFKGGISGLQGKTFSFGGETFMRAESSAQKSERSATGMTTFSSANNFCYEAVGAKSTEERHLAEKVSRAQSGLAFGRIYPCNAATEIETSKACEEVTAIKGGLTVPLDIHFSNRETLIPSSTSHKLSSHLSHSLSRKVRDRGRESKTNVSICQEQESRCSAVLRKSGGGRLRNDQANRTHRRLQESRQKRPAVNDRLVSISLDWYGSSRSEDRNDADCIDNDVRYLQTTREGADCSPGRTACPADASETDDGNTPLFTDGTFGFSKENLENSTESLNDECQILMSEGSNSEVELHDDTPGAPAFHDNASCENTLPIVQRETESQEKSGVHAEACYLKSHRSQQEGTCDSACPQQDERSIRRHSWSRSFKKKRVERVSDFETWLATGRRKASLKKRFSKFGGTRNGVKNVDKTQGSLSSRPQAEEMLDTFSSYSMGELDVKLLASIGSDCGTSHFRKGFATLEAIVELPGATAEAKLTEQHAVGDEKDRMATKVSSGEVETADLPTSTSITICRDIEKAKSRRLFEAEEQSDCVDVRSTRGHQELIQQGPNGLSPVAQALDGSERSAFSFQKSASDYQGTQDWAIGESADATQARTSPIPVKESRNSSLLIPRCSWEEKLVTGLSQTTHHNACSRNESQQSSGISTLTKEFAKERLRMDCVDSALVKAGNHESLERSQESPTDDIPKPVIIRKPKTPIVIRVRNGLANGWLLQSFIWKKFGKHKSKAAELQSPTSKDVSQKGHADPLSNSSAGLTNTHNMSAFAASLSSGPRGWKDRCGDPLDQFTIRGKETPRVSEKVIEGVATTKPFPVDVSSCSALVSAFEDYADGGEKTEQKILAKCRSIVLFKARETCVKASDGGMEGANLRHKDLQQQSVPCEVQDSQASATHTLERVGADKFLQVDGILSAESAKVQIAVQGKHQSAPSVDSEAVSVHNRGSGVRGASPESNGELGVTPANLSNEDASPPCTGSVATEVTGIFEEFSQSVSANGRQRDFKHNISSSVDQSHGRVRERSTRSSSVQKLRGELSSKCGKGFPIRGHSANARGEDVLCSVTLDPLISGEAPALSLLSDIGFKEKDPYKRFLRLLPTATATTDLSTSSQGNKDVPTSQGSSSFKKCNDLPPAIHISGNGLSSSLRDISVPTRSNDCFSCSGDKKSKFSTPQQGDKNLPKSSGRCGPAGISQPPTTETCSNGATEVGESISSHTDSRRWSTPLDVRNAFHVPETVEAPGRYNKSGPTGQRERPDCVIQNSASGASSPKCHEANNTDPGMLEEATATVSCKSSRIFEKRVDGQERKEGAKNQTKSASGVCQPENQNKSDSKSPGRYALSAVSWTAQPSGHENPDIRAVQGPGRAGSRLPQDQQAIRSYGQTGQKGNANMDGITDAAQQLLAVQGFWLPRSAERNRVDIRESHAAKLSMDQLDTCTYRSINRFVDPISWNEAKRSSTAPTLNTPLNRLRVENSEVFQPRQVRNFPSSSEPQVPNHHVLKDERQCSSFADGHTHDEVFLERFSSGKDSHNNKVQHRRKSSVDLSLLVSGSLRAPTVSATTSASDESSSFPSKDKVIPARENSLCFTRKVDPAVPRTPNSLFASTCAEHSASHPTKTIHPSPSSIEDFQQPLPYVAETALPKSIMTPNQAYRTHESGLLSDVGNSFNTVSPSSSRTGYSEDTSGKLSFKPKLCLHGSIGYDPGVPWGHYSEEAFQVKAIPAQSCIQARPAHLSTSLVHNPTLTMNHKTFRASCHAAQPCCDPCNYRSCCSTGSNGFAVCGSMFPESQYHYGPEHTLGHHIPAYISPRPREPAIAQHMRIPVSHGYVGQYAPKATVGRYAPPQTLPTRQSSWPVLDKVASSTSWDNSLPDYSELKKEQDSGLIWLTGEEMNIIRELRQSVGKESTRASDCLADPEPSPLMSLSSTATGAREGSLYAGGSNISHASSISRCSNYSSCTTPRKAHEAGTTTHTELTRDSLLKRWITSMQKAASIIQRAWRALLRRRREKVPSVKSLPTNMKDFFELIKARQSCNNFRPPSFDDFVRSVKYIQARTEGARVRRRLKSRRLQAIIMEIKEIRNLLSEMSEEANRDASAPYLYPQLCSQLQQKILQFHTALTGPQMEARFLLRRGPATPLVLYPSKSPAAGALNLTASLKLGKQHHPRMLTVLPDSKPLQTRHVTSRRQGSKGKLRPSAVSQVSLTDPPESAKLLPWYFLAQRSPSGPITGRSSPTEFTSTSHESIAKKESQETVLDSSTPQIVNKRMLPYEGVPLKTDAVNSTTNEVYEEQPVTLMQRRKTSDLSFDDIPIGTANAGMFSVDLGPAVDVLNKPKRPFLKRKSMVMAPQKLDWSKVKPMVSSRLEPELKTKLSYCRHTKVVDRPATTSISRRRKENYSQVKSRLFNYEESLSPSSSKGNTFRVRQSEQDDAETSPRSRGGSFIEGTSESGESSRLADYMRPASPNLLRLKGQVQADTEAELAYRRAQASVSESQMEPTYSSRFDSVRYQHKLEHSEQTAKDSSRESAQPRTQRIRLRLIPGSEENEPGKVLVQKIENQEEDIPDLWHEQRIAMRNRRRQSHSHRYASYRESSQVDAQPSSKLDESGRSGSPPDRKTLKAFSSSKMGLASKELEEMFERVIAAKCSSTSNLYKSQLGGRNITLSDLFEQTQNAEVKTTQTQRFPWIDRQR